MNIEQMNKEQGTDEGVHTLQFNIHYLQVE
jgi:hypothetical protein